MAQVLVRNLKEKVVARLKKRAANRGRSLQAEVKIILEEAAKEDTADFWKEADVYGNGQAFRLPLQRQRCFDPGGP